MDDLIEQRFSSRSSAPPTMRFLPELPTPTLSIDQGPMSAPLPSLSELPAEAEQGDTNAIEPKYESTALPTSSDTARLSVKTESKTKLSEFLDSPVPAAAEVTDNSLTTDERAIEELSRRGMEIEIPQLDTSLLKTRPNTPSPRTHPRRPIGSVQAETGSTRKPQPKRSELESSRELSHEGEKKFDETTFRSEAGDFPRLTKRTKAEERLEEFRRKQNFRDPEPPKSKPHHKFDSDKANNLSKTTFYRKSTATRDHNKSSRFASSSPLNHYGLPTQASSSKVSGRNKQSRYYDSLTPSPSGTIKASRSYYNPQSMSVTDREDSSEVEAAFFERLEDLRRKRREKLSDTSTRGRASGGARSRFRRPVRQLSSISEKSAEIAAEQAAISAHTGEGMFAMSAPSTTRPLLPVLERKRNLLSPPSRSKRRHAAESMITSRQSRESGPHLGGRGILAEKYDAKSTRKWQVGAG